jgi:hypothetical protein
MDIKIVEKKMTKNLFANIPNEIIEMIMEYLRICCLDSFKNTSKRINVIFETRKEELYRQKYEEFSGEKVSLRDYRLFIEKLNDMKIRKHPNFDYNFVHKINVNMDFYIYYITNMEVLNNALADLSYVGVTTYSDGKIREKNRNENLLISTLKSNIYIDIDYEDNMGLTLLMRAIILNYSKDLIKVIMKRNPNVNIRTCNNISMLNVVKMKHSKEVIKMIQDKYIYDNYNVLNIKYESKNPTKPKSYKDRLLNFVGFANSSNTKSTNPTNHTVISDIEVIKVFEIIKNICFINGINYKSNLIISGSFAVYIYQMVNNITPDILWKYNDIDIYYKQQIPPKEFNIIKDGVLLMQRISPKNNELINKNRQYDQNYINNIQEIKAIDINNPKNETSFDFINIKSNTDIDHIVEDFDLDCCKMFIKLQEDGFSLHVNENIQRDTYFRYSNWYRNQVTERRVEKYRARGFKCL